MFNVNKENRAPSLCIYMKLLCSVVDINKKHIVQYQILIKAVFVVLFLVGDLESFYLRDRDSADIVGCISLAAGDDDIGIFLIFGNLHKMAVSDNLRIGGRVKESL